MDLRSPAARPLPRWSDVVLLLALYYGGARLGVSFTVMPEGTAILWPPNAVLLAALLRFRGAGYLRLCAAAIAAEVAADLPVFTIVEALCFGALNVLEATVAMVLLLRWGFNPALASITDVTKFVIAGPVLAALAAAIPGALVYSHFRGAETGYLQFARVWWFGDGLGLMILTPLLLRLWHYGRVSARRVLRPTARQSLALLALVLMAAAVLASRNGTLLGMHVSPVLMLPAIVYIAARFGPGTTAAVIACVAAVVVIATTLGFNPFGAAEPRSAVILAQEFVFIISLMGLGLSTLLAQLRARQRELQASVAAMDELNRSLEARVAQRTAELSRANAQLEQQARTDPLTGTLNRRGLFAAADRELERSRRYGSPLALITMDLDHFKSINDRYGHAMGDAVLRHAADALRQVIRTTDVLARHGGEEFAVLVPGATASRAVAFAEKMRQVIADGANVPEGAPAITASFGVAVLRADEDFEALMRRADQMLYRAKALGRNRVEAGDRAHEPAPATPRTAGVES